MSCAYTKNDTTNNPELTPCKIYKPKEIEEKKKKRNTKGKTTNLPLHHRAGSNHFFCCLVRVLGEVVVEQLAKLVDLILEAGRRRPAVLGVEQLGRHTSAVLGDVQVEGVVHLVVGVGQLAVVDGVQDGTGVLERATLTTSGGTSTNPSGVEEPCVGLVLRDLVRQHTGVAHGVQSQERLSKAGREGGLGLGHTVLSTGHLGGVTRDEVEHGLLSGELGDRRQHTTGVASQQDDVCGVLVAQAGELGVVDVLNGVGATSVLGQGGVIIVDIPRDGVEDHVLKNRSEADGVENVGLLLLRETDALSVAL